MRRLTHRPAASGGSGRTRPRDQAPTAAFRAAIRGRPRAGNSAPSFPCPHNTPAGIPNYRHGHVAEWTDRRRKAAQTGIPL
ncbi:hypothetical protein GCM10010421_58520 [Streptomyces glaucus]|uniref:Secreted protein n=1 Tax=Streptomyces glaucus TaxID=284029 RepID=A0ABN3KEP0_9ACTN